MNLNPVRIPETVYPKGRPWTAALGGAGPEGRWWSRVEAGALGPAVISFLEYLGGAGRPSDEERDRLLRYLIYWINAPCWDVVAESAGTGKTALLAVERKRVRHLMSCEEVRDFLLRIMDLGLDPFDPFPEAA